MNERNRLLLVLNRILRRLRINNVIDYSLRGLAIGLGISSVLSVVSIFVPIPHAGMCCVILTCLSIFVHLILSIVFRPGLADAARAADALGLKERVSSSLEFIDAEDDMSGILLKDAVVYAEKISIKDNFKYKPVHNTFIMLLVLCLTATVPLFIPSPAREEAKNYENMAELKKEALENAEKEAEKLEETAELTAEMQAELEKLLAETKDEIKKAKSEEALKKAEDRFNKKLEQNIKEKLTQNALDQAKDALDALKKGELSAEEAAKLLQEMKELSEALGDDQKELSEKLEEALNDPELAESLKEALENGSLEAALSQAASGNEVSKAEMEQALQALANASANHSNSGQKQQGQNNQSGQVSQNQSQGQQSSQTGENGQQGTQSGETGQQGTQSGESGQQGSQGGQSGQQGSQQGNSGQQGTGSNGQSGQSGTGWNQGSSVGSESQHRPGTGESVAIPNYTDENLTGINNGSGDSTYTEGNHFLAVPGGSSEYEKILSQYEQKAYESFTTEKIPDSLQDIIKDYFSDISYGNTDK